MVEREGHAAVAELGQDAQGVLEAVMGEAVGVVTEYHGCSGNRSSRRGKATNRPFVALGRSLILGCAWVTGPLYVGQAFSDAAVPSGWKA